MTIEELYSEPCFEAVVYYLKQNGFSFLEDLASFDFDELYFVPNVESDIVEQAKSIYQSVAGSALEICEEVALSETPSKNETCSGGSVEEAPLSAIISDCCDKLKMLAEQAKKPDLLQKITHFLAYPAYYNKQLNDEEQDFFLFLCDELKSHLIREQYTSEEIQRMQSIPVEVLFADTVNETGRRCENVLVDYCKKHQYFTMLDLCGFDFDHHRCHQLGSGRSVRF